MEAEQERFSEKHGGASMATTTKREREDSSQIDLQSLAGKCYCKQPSKEASVLSPLLTTGLPLLPCPFYFFFILFLLSEHTQSQFAFGFGNRRKRRGDPSSSPFPALLYCSDCDPTFTLFLSLSSKKKGKEKTYRALQGKSRPIEPPSTYFIHNSRYFRLNFAHEMLLSAFSLQIRHESLAYCVLNMHYRLLQNSVFALMLDAV